MFEALDELSNEKNISTKPTYSNLAIGMVCCTLIAFILLMIFILKGLDNDKPILVFEYILDFTSLLGMAFTIMSFLKNEPDSWKKWVAGVINAILFMFVIGSIVYYLFLGNG